MTTLFAAMLITVAAGGMPEPETDWPTRIPVGLVTAIVSDPYCRLPVVVTGAPVGAVQAGRDCPG